MGWYWGDDVAAWGLAALVMGAFFAPLLLRFVSWRVQSHSDLIIYRNPVWMNVFAGLMGLWLIAAPLLLAAGERDGWVRESVVLACGISFGLGLFWLAMQRYELRLDLDTQTYRLTRGWVLRPEVKTGSWQDFDGVFVRDGTSGTRGMSFVGLTWRSGAKSPLYLGRHYDAAKAEAEAESLSLTMGVPRVAAPPPEGRRALVQ